MVARQSSGPTPTALTPEEVSAYLEREYRLISLEARRLCPDCPWMRADVYQVMLIEYIECARRCRAFDRSRVKNLWSFIRPSVEKTAVRYLKREQLRGMTVGPGRKKGGGKVAPTYVPLEGYL